MCYYVIITLIIIKPCDRIQQEEYRAVPWCKARLWQAEEHA